MASTGGAGGVTKGPRRGRSHHGRGHLGRGSPLTPCRDRVSPGPRGGAAAVLRPDSPAAPPRRRPRAQIWTRLCSLLRAVLPQCSWRDGPAGRMGDSDAAASCAGGSDAGESRAGGQAVTPPTCAQAGACTAAFGATPALARDSWQPFVPALAAAAPIPPPPIFVTQLRSLGELARTLPSVAATAATATQGALPLAADRAHVRIPATAGAASEATTATDAAAWMAATDGAAAASMAATGSLTSGAANAGAASAGAASGATATSTPSAASTADDARSAADIDSTASLPHEGNPRQLALPREGRGGSWRRPDAPAEPGLPGASAWYPTDPVVRSVTADAPIMFADNMPDFRPWSRAIVTFRPDVLCGNGTDAAEADRALAAAMGAPPRALSPPPAHPGTRARASGAVARALCRDAGLDWHHDPDCRSMLLLDRRLHQRVPHHGGAWLLRQRRAARCRGAGAYPAAPASAGSGAGGTAGGNT